MCLTFRLQEIRIRKRKAYRQAMIVKTSGVRFHPFVLPWLSFSLSSNVVQNVPCKHWHPPKSGISLFSLRPCLQVPPIIARLGQLFYIACFRVKLAQECVVLLFIDCVVFGMGGGLHLSCCTGVMGQFNDLIGLHWLMQLLPLKPASKFYLVYQSVLLIGKLSCFPTLDCLL